MKYYIASFMYMGKKKQILVKGENKIEAINRAKKMQPGVLVTIKETSIPFEEKIRVFKDIFSNKVLRKRINYPAYISALHQLAVLLKASISLKEALEDISENTKDPLIKEIFKEAADAINQGKNLTDTFQKYQNYIGGISVAMVKLGEETGNLGESINALANIYQKIYNNIKKIKKALRYPIFTLLAIAGAFTFLVLVVVPKFKSIFNMLHSKLPLATRSLLKTQEIFSHYGLLILAGIIALIVFSIFMYKTSDKFKYKTDRLLLKIPVLGKIIEYGNLSRILNSIASLLSSGISLTESLKISKGIVGNEEIREKINYIINGVNQGKSFADMLENTKFVNYIALRMIKSGEQSGELENMLKNASDYYESKFQDIIDNIQSAIEPFMLIIIGAMVLWLALGIFMPMWDLANAAKHAAG
jgi:general secretion pathway protein F